MPTIFTKGDLLNTEGVRAYALGGNCAGTLDAGIAVAFKKRWPALAAAYAQRAAERKIKLGEAFAWTEGKDTVYLLAIQETAAKKANLPALEQAINAMIDLATKAKIEKIALPRLGAGTAALDPLRVKRVLTEIGAGTPVSLMVFEQFVRAKTA
ncbi:MAG: macro domain-containing protein [Byssovorax sp.]